MLTVGELENDREVCIAKINSNGDIVPIGRFVGRTITDDNGVLYLIQENNEITLRLTGDDLKRLQRYESERLSYIQ